MGFVKRVETVVTKANAISEIFEKYCAGNLVILSHTSNVHCRKT